MYNSDMRYIVIFFCCLLSLFGLADGGVSTPRGFTDNFDEALKRAGERDTLIYIVFSGSDWCGGCMGLERQLLSKSEFVDAVKDHWELIFIDVPKDKSRLSEWGAAHNEVVRGRFGVNKFPTVYVLDKFGEKIANGDTGLGSAPSQVAERMNRFKIRYLRRQKVMDRVGKAKPGTRSRVLLLHKYLQSLELAERGEEREILDEVIAADKKQQLGLKDYYFYYTDIEPIANELQECVGKYLVLKDRTKAMPIMKKRLAKLEARAVALKAPKGCEEDRKELINAVREAKAFIAARKSVE